MDAENFIRTTLASTETKSFAFDSTKYPEGSWPDVIECLEQLKRQGLVEFAPVMHAGLLPDVRCIFAKATDAGRTWLAGGTHSVA